MSILFSSRRRHTRCALVTGVQTCALPIWPTFFSPAGIHAIHFQQRRNRLWHSGMLTLPNILTLSRIFAVPLLVGLLWFPQWQTGYAFAFALYCLMGITDYFAGYLRSEERRVGK